MTEITPGSTRIPPQNIEAEQAVLGSIMMRENLLHKVLDTIKPEDFYKDRHKIVFETIIALFSKNEPYDLLTVTDYLISTNQLEKAGGAAYIGSLTSLIPITSNIGSYARIVREKSILRKLIQVNNEVAARCYESPGDIDRLVDDAEQAIFDIAGNKSSSQFSDIKTIVPKVFDNINTLYSNKSLITGVPTGFDEFNKMTSGLQPSDLIILAARPSMGKTSLAMNIAEYAALQENIGVAVFSLEMSKEQLVMRMLSSVGRIDSQAIRKGRLQRGDWDKLSKAVGLLSDAPIYIDDTPGITALEMRAKVRRLAAQHKIGLIIVDYLQLMQGRSTENRTQEISDISRSLKALAKEHNVPVVALSQLNRSVESRTDKRPMMSDLRESGAIEQDADIICFIYRDEVYNKAEDNPAKGQAELIIAKQRNGPTGYSTLWFEKECTRFENMTYREDVEEFA